MGLGDGGVLLGRPLQADHPASVKATLVVAQFMQVTLTVPEVTLACINVCHVFHSPIRLLAFPVATADANVSTRRIAAVLSAIYI